MADRQSREVEVSQGMSAEGDSPALHLAFEQGSKHEDAAQTGEKHHTKVFILLRRIPRSLLRG